ncbi:MAG: acyltransferase [Gammaproteobacteria bacterium]|nr:acyltransferase [Gammaproteobacteria bacterium]
MRIWSQARELAAQTPPERNRYIDFLRAASILIVIVGHWLIATFYFTDNSIAFGLLLKSHPQTQWLTWVFQVMPVFFIVGGYSNALSLESAHRKGIGYGGWLAGRLNRLVTPLLVLVACWAAISMIMYLFDASPEVIQYTSQASLIPTWFLAIYIMVVLLAPATHLLWQRYGFRSFGLFAGSALLIDIAFFAADLRWLGWVNYVPVWLAVHHLGYVWRDDRINSRTHLMVYSALGLLALTLLVFIGPYPLAMVGSPDTGLSNSTPPKITILALGLFQFGLLLALEAPMRQKLERLGLWTATVLINSMIMTVYLWHITIMIIFVSLLYLTGGVGLEIEPGGVTWWLTRPLWIAVLLVFLVPLALLLSPLERRSRRREGIPASPGRQITGAIMVCLGIALLARFGFGNAPLSYLDIVAFTSVVLGAGICGVLGSSMPKEI